MGFSLRSRLAGCVAVGGLIAEFGICLAPGLAAAQTATPQPAAGTPPSATTNPATTAAGEGGIPQDVIVTATRRNEALRNVPIAVTAVSGETVRASHVENFQDVPALVPGANFVSTKGPSTANIQIRGQSTTNDAPALELPVAIFMDDVYFGTLASFDADFFDVGQIAVLRGPQGTTFGRNVVGGALQITSNKPVLHESSGEANVSIESYNRHDSVGGEGQGYFNVPIGDTMAGRLAYSIKDIDGYMYNNVTGHNLSDQKSFALRPSFLWNVTNDLTLNSFVSYSHENEYAAGYKAFGQGSVVAGDKAIANSPWDSFQNVDGQNRRDIYVGQLKLDWRQPYGSWTSITSYRALNAYYLDDGDSGPLNSNSNSVNASKEFQFSEEVRLTSPSNQRLEYVAGVYSSFENLRKQIQFGFNGTIPNLFLDVLTKNTLQNETVTGDAHVNSIAPFAEAKFHINKQFALTLGGRYTIEDKDGYTKHLNGSAFYGAPFNVNFSHTWYAFTPRGIFEYKPRDGLLFYGSISTGFKGGGWSLTSTSAKAAVIPLEPEKSTSYELGAKTDFFDRRMSINIAAYQADTRNLQVRSLVGPVLTDTNAGEERVRGVEVESVFRPIHGLEAGINYAYTDAFYESFTGCAAGGVNCTGNAVPFVPKNDLKIFLTYHFDLGQNGSLITHADDDWASKTQVVPTAGQQAAVPFTKKDGFLNAFLTYEPAHGNWKVQLWAKNLTNRYQIAAPSNYYFYFLTQAEYGSGLREVDRGVVTPPRQLGATLTYRF